METVYAEVAHLWKQIFISNAANKLLLLCRIKELTLNWLVIECCCCWGLYITKVKIIFHTFTMTSENRKWFLQFYYFLRFRTIVLVFKTSIERPGRYPLFSTHNFWTTCHRTMIKAYSDRKVSILSEYAFTFVPLCMYQKLCVQKKWIYPFVNLSRFYSNIL